MSTSNIDSQFAVKLVGYFVRFQTRTQGTVTYGYSESDGAQIAGGADPKEFEGLKIEGPGDIAQLAAQNAVTNVIEVAKDVIEGAIEDAVAAVL